MKNKSHILTVNQTVNNNKPFEVRKKRMEYKFHVKQTQTINRKPSNTFIISQPQQPQQTIKKCVVINCFNYDSIHAPLLVGLIIFTHLPEVIVYCKHYQNQFI